MQRCAVPLPHVVTSLSWRACMSHVFMHCPVVQPAVVWLQDLWAACAWQPAASGRQGAGCW